LIEWTKSLQDYKKNKIYTSMHDNFMIKLFRLVLLLIFLNIPAFSQNVIDSLENLLFNANNVSEKYKIYSQLIYEYAFLDPTKALKLSEQAILLLENNSDSSSNADLYNSIGIAYHLNGNFLVSIEYFLKSLNLYEEQNDSSKIANVLNNIGITYTEIRNFEKSKSFYHRSLKIHRKLNNINETSALLNNLGNDFETEGIIDSAEYYYKRSLNIALEYELQARLADVYLNLGSIKYSKKNLGEALDYLLKALEIDKKRENYAGLVETYGLLGEIYLDLNQNSLAYQYMSQALALSQRLHMKNRESEIFETLSKYFASVGDYQAAYEKHLNYSNLKDSIYTLEAKRQIEDLQLSYENNKKEQEIALLSERTILQETQLKLQKTKTRLLLVFTIFTIFVLVLLIVNIKLKNKANNLLRVQNEKIQHQNKELADRSKRLIELSDEKDNFINVVAHDLKSPLNNISGLSNLIRINGKLNEEQIHYLNLLDQVSSEAKNLIINLLDINKLESDNLEENYEEFNIGEIIDREINFFKKDAQEKNISISKKCNNNIIINNNKEFVQRILNNLLSNALKFSPENKKIVVSSDYKNQYLSLVVKDEGPGISKKEQKYLFKKFQKLSTRPTAGESSTGLGLAIVKLLVEKLKGQIFVKSEINKGAEFIVKFPASLNGK